MAIFRGALKLLTNCTPYLAYPEAITLSYPNHAAPRLRNEKPQELLQS